MANCLITNIIAENKSIVRAYLKLWFKRFDKPIPKLIPGQSASANDYLDFYCPRTLTRHLSASQRKKLGLDLYHRPLKPNASNTNRNLILKLDGNALVSERPKGATDYCWLPKFSRKELEAERTGLLLSLDGKHINVQKIMLVWFLNETGLAKQRAFKTKCNNPTCCNPMHLLKKQTTSRKGKVKKEETDG